MKGQCLPYVKVPTLFYMLYVCYFLFKIGFDRVTFSSSEPMRFSKCVTYGKNSTLFIHLLFPIGISGDSAAYVTEMIMLIFCRSHDPYKNMVIKTTYGPRQAKLVLIAYASTEGSGEPAHPCSLARTSAARSYKQ